MRITAFLLLFSVIQVMGESSYSQNTRLSLNIKDVSIENVLDEIENQSEFYFLFNQKLVNVDRKVDIDVKNKSIKDILADLFTGEDVNCLVMNRQIVLSPKNITETVNVTRDRQPQEIVVTGKVTDEDGNTLPGVNIIVKGTITGAITDVDGNYSIEVEDSDATLVFSFIGYESQEILVGNQTTINVTLEIEAYGLDEVVAVGYATQKRVNITGSVSTIESEELVKVPAANISSSLRGEISGLLVQQSVGAPGMENIQISIRGYDHPLVLIDGVEMSWERVDPNDIESISVLKDASAAIYGSRAGDGVILINTKRGKTDKMTLKYNGNISFQDPVVLPDFVDSWKYAQLLREGELFQGLECTYSEEEVQKFKEGGDPNYPNTHWYDEIFTHWTPLQTHNFSAQGGSEKIKYFLSVGYLDQASLYKSGDLNFNRYNARSNIDAQMTENLSISLDLSYRNELRDQPQASLGEIWYDTFWARPDYPAHIPDPELGAAYAGFNQRSPFRQTYQQFTGFIDDRRENLRGKLSINYKIPGVKGLEANAELNYLLNNTFKKTQDKPFEVLEYNYESKTYNSYGFNGSNKLDENFSKYTQFYPIVSFNYEKSFGDHSVKGLLLSEWINGEYKYFSAGKVDLLSLELPFLFAGSPENISADGYTRDEGRASYVGRFNYNYKEKYLLEATFRYDASSKFPAESRWGFFPSVSAGWRLSEEDFMKNFSWIDYCKLRLSYSKTGNDNVEAFKYLTGYNIRKNIGDYTVNERYIFGGNVYRMIAPIGLPNPNITWLNMINYNIGLDALFLDNLIGFEFDVFYRIVDDIFGEPLESFPSTFGAQLPQLNLNSTDDRGFELKLIHRNRISKDLSYSIVGNFSYAREKYRDWAENPYDDPDEIRIYQKEGYYTNRTIGYVSDGLFMSQNEIDNHPIDQDQAGNTTLLPGDVKYKDLNNDDEITWRDQKEIGYSNFPDVCYGLNLNMEYKRLSFTALFEGASMFSHSIQYFPFNNFGPPMEFHWKYCWRPDENDLSQNKNPEAQLPTALGDGTGRNPNNEKISDFWEQDATYVRLKKLNISYSFPKKWIQTIGIQDIRISLAATNLITLSKLGIYKNSIDPEAVSRNQWSYPPVKTISLGINLTM